MGEQEEANAVAEFVALYDDAVSAEQKVTALRGKWASMVESSSKNEKAKKPPGDGSFADYIKDQSEGIRAKKEKEEQKKANAAKKRAEEEAKKTEALKKRLDDRPAVHKHAFGLRFEPGSLLSRLLKPRNHVDKKGGANGDGYLGAFCITDGYMAVAFATCLQKGTDDVPREWPQYMLHVPRFCSLLDRMQPGLGAGELEAWRKAKGKQNQDDLAVVPWLDANNPVFGAVPRRRAIGSVSSMYPNTVTIHVVDGDGSSSSSSTTSSTSDAVPPGESTCFLVDGDVLAMLLIHMAKDAVDELILTQLVRPTGNKTRTRTFVDTHEAALEYSVAKERILGRNLAVVARVLREEVYELDFDRRLRQPHLRVLGEATAPVDAGQLENLDAHLSVVCAMLGQHDESFVGTQTTTEKKGKTYRLAGWFLRGGQEDGKKDAEEQQSPRSWDDVFGLYAAPQRTATKKQQDQQQEQQQQQQQQEQQQQQQWQASLRALSLAKQFVVGINDIVEPLSYTVDAGDAPKKKKEKKKEKQQRPKAKDLPLAERVVHRRDHVSKLIQHAMRQARLEWENQLEGHGLDDDDDIPEAALDKLIDATHYGYELDIRMTKYLLKCAPTQHVASRRGIGFAAPNTGQRCGFELERAIFAQLNSSSSKTTTLAKVFGIEPKKKKPKPQHLVPYYEQIKELLDSQALKRAGNPTDAAQVFGEIEDLCAQLTTVYAAAPEDSKSAELQRSSMLHATREHLLKWFRIRSTLGPDGRSDDRLFEVVAHGSGEVRLAVLANQTFFVRWGISADDIREAIIQAGSDEEMVFELNPEGNMVHLLREHRMILLAESQVDQLHKQLHSMQKSLLARFDDVRLDILQQEKPDPDEEPDAFEAWSTERRRVVTAQQVMKALLEKIKDQWAIALRHALNGFFSRALLVNHKALRNHLLDDDHNSKPLTVTIDAMKSWGGDNMASLGLSSVEEAVRESAQALVKVMTLCDCNLAEDNALERFHAKLASVSQHNEPMVVDALVAAYHKATRVGQRSFELNKQKGHSGGPPSGADDAADGMAQIGAISVKCKVDRAKAVHDAVRGWVEVSSSDNNNNSNNNNNNNSNNDDDAGSFVFYAMTYNILEQNHLPMPLHDDHDWIATVDRHPEQRQHLIVSQILHARSLAERPSIIALQEVNPHDAFALNAELAPHGYQVYYYNTGTNTTLPKVQPASAKELGVFVAWDTAIWDVQEEFVIRIKEHVREANASYAAQSHDGNDLFAAIMEKDTGTPSSFETVQNTFNPDKPLRCAVCVILTPKAAATERRQEDPPPPRLLVTAVHMPAKPPHLGGGWMRLLTALAVQRELEHLKETKHVDHVLLMGDFNATPDSASYAALTAHGGSFVDPAVIRAHADDLVPPPRPEAPAWRTEPLFTSKHHADDKALQQQVDDQAQGQGGWLYSTYHRVRGREPKVTNWMKFRPNVEPDCVDYIFASRGIRTLAVCKTDHDDDDIDEVYRKANEKKKSGGGWPDEIRPSDHIPLLAKLALSK